MSKGRIDVTFEPTVVEEIQGLIAQIEARMPFLIRLSTNEKRLLAKPRAGADSVIQAVIDLQRTAGLVSADDAAMAADFSVYTGLLKISDLMSNLLQRIDDTKLQAGSESWNASLIRYGMLRHVERRNPDVKAGLDRLRPLINRRAPRPAPVTEPERPVPGDEPAE